ncbi:MAG: VanW family protein [Patescibacteria group bacterium]|nr:VanW family protein [Patescibacteria group bacterium]
MGKTNKKNKPEIKRNKSLLPPALARIFSHWAVLGALAAVLICGIIYGTSWAYAKNYENKIFPGVKIGSVDIGGLTRDQASEKLSQAIQDFLDNGFTLKHADKQVALMTNEINEQNPEASRELVNYNIDSMISAAWNLGREASWLSRISSQARARTLGVELAAEFGIEENSVVAFMKNIFKEYDSPAANARIMITMADNSTNPILTVEPEHSGQTLDYAAALSEIEKQLLLIESAPIELESVADEPEISAAEAEEMLPAISQAMALAPVKIKYSTDFENFSWNIASEDFAAWLTLKKAADGNILIGFLEEGVKTTLAEAANLIEVEPQNAKFKMENNRVIEFAGSNDGITIDWPATIANFEQLLLTDKQKDAAIIVKITEPEIKIADLNDLGIKELIGVGRSNFKGSPVNRRHNIRVGSEKLNGLLVPADEEFSTITNLAPVNAENGYLPELVIKENKTLPEYGGGLCQIGTTMFRVAISAGLPITERNPHSYRVVYYEPAGKDAAVYEMHPDLRFLNDTENYILIQTRIEGDELVFEFWGTPDNREIYQSDSRITNITSPPALKEVETLDLAPGEKKCTESAHAGADAEFDYKVTYPDGKVKETTFTSHYRPWGAVCLIGVAELSTPPVDEASTPGDNPAEPVIPE